MCLAVWSNPHRLKLSAIVWSIISFGAIVGLSGQLLTPPEGLLPLYLLPLAAAASALGQPVHENHRLSWIMTLVCLGFGVGALTGHDLVGQAVPDGTLGVHHRVALSPPHRALADVLVGHRLVRFRLSSCVGIVFSELIRRSHRWLLC